MKKALASATNADKGGAGYGFCEPYSRPIIAGKNHVFNRMKKDPLVGADLTNKGGERTEASRYGFFRPPL